MKKLLLLLAACVSLTASVNAQVCITTTGYKVTPGQGLVMGRGTADDGSFRHIRINERSMFQYTGPGAAHANMLLPVWAGKTLTVKRVEKRDAIVYAIVGVNALNYQIDLDQAIKTGELSVPEEFRYKDVTLKPQLSIADELIKLKQLLDTGVLSQAEFDAQKAKLLNP